MGDGMDAAKFEVLCARSEYYTSRRGSWSVHEQDTRKRTRTQYTEYLSHPRFQDTVYIILKTAIAASFATWVRQQPDNIYSSKISILLYSFDLFLFYLYDCVLKVRHAVPRVRHASRRLNFHMALQCHRVHASLARSTVDNATFGARLTSLSDRESRSTAPLIQFTGFSAFHTFVL